ncbi:uncharacterized protein LOC143904336 isoform X2 [Temnothorax americanus]|uniref:uncharacterized protein LOC143904336 isoform X2 n=1 Tax=Temnothorax americanus TaxID=1964332 RepID=UPI004067ABFB
MESTNAERTQQRKDKAESSSLLPLWPYLPPSTADSSFLTLSCDCASGCEECNYGAFAEIREKCAYKRGRGKKFPSAKESFSSEGPCFVEVSVPFKKTSNSFEENTKSPETNEVSVVKTVTKSKSELFVNYCPYSSDNCSCKSGCAKCDYALYTYTVKNKSKLTSKVCKPLYVRSSNGFRKTSNGSRKTAKSFSLLTMNISRKKKARFPKEVALESCYPESSSSCDRKSVYVKRNVKLYTPKKRVPKIEKRTSARISKNLKTTKTVRTLKLISSKKVPKNVVAEISERDFMKNWFPDSSSSNSNDCNSGCTDCGELITAKKKKLKHRSERTRASTSTGLSELLRNIGTSSVIEESVKNKEDSKQTAEIFSKRRLSSRSSCNYSESDSYFTDEDCCNNKCGNIRQSRRTKNLTAGFYRNFKQYANRINK